MTCALCGKNIPLNHIYGEQQHEAKSHFMYCCKMVQTTDHGRTFICDCGFRSAVRDDFLEHQVLQHTIVKIKCDICGKEFNPTEIVKNEFETHVSEYHK